MLDNGKQNCKNPYMNEKEKGNTMNTTTKCLAYGAGKAIIVNDQFEVIHLDNNERTTVSTHATINEANKEASRLWGMLIAGTDFANLARLI